MIDVAGGDKVPRKGGPGITGSDLLVVNKIDLAEAVGADLGVMERDARRMRFVSFFLLFLPLELVICFVFFSLTKNLSFFADPFLVVTEMADRRFLPLSSRGKVCRRLLA